MESVFFKNGQMGARSKCAIAQNEREFQLLKERFNPPADAIRCLPDGFSRWALLEG